MRALPDDVIVALATAPGPGARAIVRLSGSGISSILKVVFSPADAVPPPAGRFVSGGVALPGVQADADRYAVPRVGIWRKDGTTKRTFW